jgi:hypothetical protein
MAQSIRKRAFDVLVDLVRFELTTSSMPWKRAPNCATGPSDDDFNISCALGYILSCALR